MRNRLLHVYRVVPEQPLGGHSVTVRRSTRLEASRLFPVGRPSCDLEFVTCTLGYATASSLGQNLEAQLAALNAAGVDPRRVFTDKLTESADRLRAGLHAMLSYARSGDTVIVVAIDRLGRSAAEVARTVADLNERGIRLRSLKEGLDTGTSTGRVVASVITALAQLDRQPERQRT
jgi:DNA invertase Pin-like site-specific DNA recombinase